MSSCNNLAKKYNLNTKTDVKKWFLKHHPDKNDGKIHIDFNKINDCYQNNSFVFKNNDSTKKNNFSNSKITKKRRNKMFSCMRKLANFSKIENIHKFDKKVFDPVSLENTLDFKSPKMIQLLNNIKDLDTIDQKNHGKKFKHFIFSDVKEGGYGAKIIASALISNGYNNVIKARKIPKQKKMRLYIDYDNSNKNFGLLSSNSIYGATFNEKIKKELLKLFNERPGNINGNKLRFIIFDSGFKEGIDLFDVKYVHIFEPSMTIADLKQTVGRATRTCGQKGLDFIPNIGWPLYVYNYYLTVPDITQNTFSVPKSLTYNTNDKEDDVFIFKNIEKFNDATMLYSEFDSAMNNLSKQLFELAPSLAVDYILTKNLHNVEDINNQYMENDYYLMGGTKKDLMKKVNKKSKFFLIDQIKCKGKCGKRNTNDIPVSTDYLKQIYLKYKYPKKNLPKTNLREFLCNFMRDNKDFCKQINREWAVRMVYVPQIIEKIKNPKKIKEKLDENNINIHVDDNNNDDNLNVEDIKYEIIQYNGVNQQDSTNSFIPKTRMNFIKMRDFIKTNYNSKQYKWDKLVIENKCIPKKETQNTNTSDIELNPTQNFITKYFCPESPYKGLLLWHSVGTGKTCSGVSIASSTFEREGYNILWVTRTTLKSDVWKNIFDQICHSIIAHEVKNGLLIPEKISDRKKLLSNKWLEPMSYKQFSNLLAGKNTIYNILKERNGSEDILKKTLIIIDEAHKLYGGDLKASERPDTKIMEKLIMNSYIKSGKDSCKLLIMTATPFTNSPLELFNLINLFYTNEKEKFTTDKEEFKMQYMTKDGILSENGIKNIANKTAGYISYLNREKDATQFAQPIMLNIPILLSHIQDNDIRNIIYLNEKIDNLNKKNSKLILELKEKIKVLKNNRTSVKNEIKTLTGEINTKCKEETDNKKDFKECLKKYDSEINILNEKLKEILTQIQEIEIQLNDLKEDDKQSSENKTLLKTKVRNIKKELLQEFVLYKKCMEFNYNKLIQKNNFNKAKTFSLKKNKNNFTKKNKTI